ncbi:UDP-N-acetyl-D-mannosamine dehydrogenase [Pseudanabaena mucicola]|uniref:UDP-N-acetyl-D-mannosamine dehydrogenase n=1 Tax=Pseudanabaena mucicola FACHB-723 TaxID=2692860 RepID=A0ABR7ZUM2_9CYAN|nr:UDP-N-acetyl-D-mannosamine dehydrogenase [Pseudanabaena mucicola]MBD2187108.1 UDP-N-acetyl-D-mannosamine dehydrogenase [Pseudanabaena mucicola FACHB-723]
MTFTKVCVIGLGYIGLPIASLLATKGLKVHGVDINSKILENLNRGEIHIHEPGLDAIVKSAILSENLQVSDTPQVSDIFIIAVPTPLADDNIPDISYIKSAIWSLAPYISSGNLLIIESTIPVGTTEKVASWLENLRPDLYEYNVNSENTLNNSSSVFIAHCPERVLPGKTVEELITNDRIIGGINPASAQKAKWLYQNFVSGEIFITDARTAELCKLTENAFRDVNIAFANELSMICDELKINVWELIKLANRHPRVNILEPGPGVGGHCIAVDPWFIVSSAPQQSNLIKTSRQINDKKTEYVVEQVKKQAVSLKQPIIACLGLAFKADIDDLRESPSVNIVQALVASSIGKIIVVEPYINQLPHGLNNCDIKLTSLDTAISEANLILILVNHKQFYTIPKEILNKKVVIDTRGVLEV